MSCLPSPHLRVPPIVAGGCDGYPKFIPRKRRLHFYRLRSNRRTHRSGETCLRGAAGYLAQRIEYWRGIEYWAGSIPLAIHLGEDGDRRLGGHGTGGQEVTHGRPL